MKSKKSRVKTRAHSTGFKFLSVARATLFSLPACLFAMLLVFNSAVVAQERQPAPTVTATATAERVRFNSPGSVTQMRLEVFDASGERLFDSGFLSGNILDWPVQNQRGDRLDDGSYLCVATARDLDRRQSRKAAALTVASGQGRLEPLKVERLTAGQAQALEAGRQAISLDSTGSDDSLTVLAESKPAALTVAAHDGRDGKVVSTQGALTLGTGNIFAGTNVDHVRITEEGRVGIGTDKPETALDVAGEVKARGGIRFSDGTTLDASGGKLTLTDAAGDKIPSPLAAGTGTAGRLAKWTETGGAGTLGDSRLFETGANVGVNTTSPLFPFDVRSNTNVTPLGVTGNNSDALGFGIRNTAPAAKFWTFQVAGSSNSLGLLNGTFFMRQATDGFTPLFIRQNGYIGIGAPEPIREVQIGSSLDAAFTLSPTDGTPNAGYIRFGDNTGWKLHFGRNREASGRNLNSGTTGVLMTIQDNGNVGIGTTAPQAKLDVNGQVRGDLRVGANGELGAVGGEENLRIVRGVINFAGVIGGGSGFTVSHTATGHYTVTFDTPFVAVPAVTAMTNNIADKSPIILVRASEVKFGSIVFTVFRRSDGSFENENFHFIAIGPR